MATTYTWTVTSLECGTDLDLDCDVIERASWILSGNDETNTSSVSGSVPINLSMAVEQGHEEGERYNTLTEAEVITAIQTALGTNWVASLQSDIDKDLYIKSLQTPPAPTVVISPPLPWVV